MSRIAGRIGLVSLPGLAIVLMVWAPGRGAEGASEPAADLSAQRILTDAGVKGGLVVHVGCRDGRVTAALRANDSYLVHGLDADAASVAKAREYIEAQGIYGSVSVEQWTEGHLPYADNLVNLLVLHGPSDVRMREVRRVLSPGGVAYIRIGQKWTRNVKPRPGEIDEWTHFLHDATNNAVARDSLVGPPRHVQWVGGPRFARSHEHLASVSVAVSSGGRLFYIVDEGPTASVTLPPKWMLVARDAFSGVVLWKKPIPAWEWHLRGFRSGPPQTHRRLVAAGDTVYATLGYGTPLTALDAATGDTLKTYEGTKGTEEIMHEEGVLFLVVGDPEGQEAVEEAIRRGEAVPPVERRIVAMKADTGSVLWEKADRDAAELMPMTLAVGGGRAFFHTVRDLVCLDAGSGRELWRDARPVSLERPAWSSPTVVVAGDVVLSGDRAAPATVDEDAGTRYVSWDVSIRGGNAPPGEVIAYSTKTGERLWSAPCREGYNAPVDLFVARGLVWTGDLVRAKDPGITQARDLVTGEVEVERPADQEFFQVGMSHHRCYRNKATEDYILLGRAGVEFLDMATGRAIENHWVRGTCQHGVLPCNGLLYAPPHSCACFIQAKLNGFFALAAQGQQTAAGEVGTKLERGPAYGSVETPGAASETDDWPTYRHDPRRSGGTASAVPVALHAVWQAALGGELSSPVIADGRVFVASVDAHTVHALDAEGGMVLWSYTAGGRVDSPPTVHRGRILFGSADGWVYCLRASDGALVWRFRAARKDRRIVSYGQLESAWPVHGSVLVEEATGGSGGGIVYFVAGRSSFLDGGIYLYRLDATTGRKLSETCVSGRDPETGEQPDGIISGFGMPGALPDVLSSDGSSVYMRHVRFSREGVQQDEPVRHVFTPTGFLDDTWWHRSYWQFGTEYQAGWGGWWRVGNIVPSGRILSLDDSSVYGFGRDFIPGGNAGQWSAGEQYHLFAIDKDAELPEKLAQGGKAKEELPYRWARELPFHARAMLLAGETLFMAGPMGDGRHSLDAFEGREGITLWAVSAGSGERLAEWELDAMPVFDGMAAAGGKLYVSLKDGRLVCMGGV